MCVDKVVLLTGELCVPHHVAGELVHDPTVEGQHEGAQVEQGVALQGGRPRETTSARRTSLPS